MEEFCVHLFLVPDPGFDHNICSLVTDEYNRGYADGYAAREIEFEGLQRQVDYWYLRALNPDVKTPEQKMVESIMDGIEVNEYRARRRAELDAADEERFAEARALIAAGEEDVAIAVKVGLFLPVVQNIRAGAL